MLISICAVGLGVLAYVAQSGIALHQLAGSDSRAFLSVLGMHANDQGRLFAFAYALLLFTWAEAKEPGLRAALLASMALMVTALVLTFSRGAFGAFILVNVLFLFWRRRVNTLILFGLAALIALFALPAAVYERLSSGDGEGLDAISAGRIDWLWLPLLPEVMRSPVYGSGLGSILWSQPMRVGGGANVLLTTHPHNAYLQALLDTGALGLLLLCAYLAHVFWKFWKLGSDPAVDPALRGFFQGAAAGLLGFLASSLTDGSLMPRPEQALLWLAIGMMYGQLHKRLAR
jgi:O-antigen ligase